MKHYLLTWYGITDLRAALGIEPTSGPVLGALRTRKYSDVVIVAYTNPGKASNGFADEMRARWEKFRTSDLEVRLKFPREIAQQFVDALSNTEAGHVLFTDWLKAELATLGVSCNIQLIPWELRHLNDAHAIFAAAAFAVNRALADSAEKTITTYVSPGTPVMAYTWALIAKAHPQHNIAVIASSEARLPPETIDLPKGLLMPVLAGFQSPKPSEYDVIVHLLGRERMPIYFGMLQFKAGVHIFITTQDYLEAANVLSRRLPKTCQSKSVTIQDPFRPADTRRAIEREVSRLASTARVAVNLTGGTKLMFAGALAACWERGLEPFYFESNDHNIIFIRDGVTVPFVGAKTVSDFLAVNGFDVLTEGRWEDKPCRAARTELTDELWRARNNVGKLYQTADFRNYRVPWGKGRNPPFSWKWANSHATFSGKGDGTLVLSGVAWNVPACDDFGQYLGGGWFEEYVYRLLRDLETRGLIHDLRIGMEVGYSGKSHRPNEAPMGEFDCAFTDGKRLWLVECKAGNVKQEHIQKLENNLKTYGGIAARGIIASSFPIGSSQANRIRSSSAIVSVHAGEVRSDVLELVIAS